MALGVNDTVSLIWLGHLSICDKRLNEGVIEKERKKKERIERKEKIELERKEENKHIRSMTSCLQNCQNIKE